MENKKLSVIVPVYNVEKYLAKCVDSILSQTFADFELILVDDGSTDSSPALCDEYAKKDRRVQVIHQENGGVSVARNVGIQASLYDWITFVDPDDWIEPLLYETAMAAVAEYGADFVYWNCVTFGKGREEKIMPIAKGRIVTEKLACLHGVVWRAIYQKAVLSKYGICFPEHIPYLEDMPFVYKCLSVAKNPWCIGIYGYHYFLRTTSATNSIQGRERICFTLDMIHEVELFLEEHNKAETFSGVLCWRILVTKTQFLSVVSNRADFENFRKLYPEINPSVSGRFNKLLCFFILQRNDFLAGILCGIRNAYRKLRYGARRGA